MKLGRHINTWTPAAKSSVRAAPGGSLMILSTAVDREMVQFFHDAVPEGPIIFRLYEEYQNSNVPEQRVDALCAAVEPIRDLVTAVIVPGNEMDQSEVAKHEGQPSPIERFTEYTIVSANLLHARGFPTVLGGTFSKTKPTMAAWQVFMRALSHLEGVVFHEYWTTLIDRGGFLHYQQLYAQTPAELQKDVYILECGIDDDHGGGYRLYCDGELYAKNVLRPTIAEYARDPQVKAVTVFACGVFD